jgi:hypothetical protein
MVLKSESLFALADTPEGRDQKVTDVGIGELNAVRKVYAEEKVVILDSGREVRSDRAEFFLGSNVRCSKDMLKSRCQMPT